MTRKKKGKVWSVHRIRHPKYPGYTVRVAEYPRPGGTLYAFRWIDGRQRMTSLKCRRVDLGKTPTVQEREARKLACVFIEGLVEAQEEEQQRKEHHTSDKRAPLTFGSLADKYEVNGFHGRTSSYKRDAVSAVRRVAAHLGEDRDAASLTPSDVQAYAAHRLAQGVRAAGRADLVQLKIALNWAAGEGLLGVNPFDSFKKKRLLPPKGTERRAVCAPERYRKLSAVADHLPPAFGVLLTLAWETGHRISAILELRWSAIVWDRSEAAPHGAIRWYAGAQANTKRHEHVVPINEQAREALEHWREHAPGIADAHVFPGVDGKRPLGRWVAKRWLTTTEKLAKVPHLEHGGWHQFRRGWGTLRKNLPLKDVAAAGGWQDTATMLRSYQHADPVTTLAVVNYDGK